MKSVSPSVWRARLTHRLALCLSLLLLSSSLPFVTHGQLQTDAPEIAGRAWDTHATGKRAEFVPGSVLVRFRSDKAAKMAEAATAALPLADGGQVPLSIEAVAGSNLVAGLRHVTVAPEDTLAAVKALNERPDVLYAEPDYVR